MQFASKLLIVYLFLTSQLSAWVFTPMVINTSSTRPQGFFRVYNEGDETVAVEIFALTRKVDIYGQESNERIDGDFFIYPSQLIVKPGQEKRIRVMFRGDSDPNLEEAFRIVAFQHPVEIPVDIQANDDDGFSDNGVSIAMGRRYTNSFYVQPPKAFSNLTIEFQKTMPANKHHKRRFGDEINSIARFLVTNDGNRHQYMPFLQVSLLNDSRQMQHLFDYEYIKSYYPHGVNIQAQSSLYLDIPVADTLNIDESLSPSLAYKE